MKWRRGGGGGEGGGGDSSGDSGSVSVGDGHGGDDYVHCLMTSINTYGRR